jgi:acyl-CoA synthetase (AMP-forming)/AMP-acid ligase II
MKQSRGIPLHGAFGQPGPAWGTHTPDGWRVQDSINRTQTESLFGNREVRAFIDRHATYDQMIRASAQRSGEREAVICSGRRISWRELDDLIDRTAWGLLGAGLAAGDRVAVMLDNRLEFIVAVLACVRAGGIAVPLGTRLGPADVDYIVGHATPSFGITALEWRSRFPATSSMRRIFLVDGEEEEQRFDALAKAPAAPLPALRSEDTMMIVYTSGTTGKPKGACLTHVNFVHTCLHYLYALAIDEPQRSLLVVPAPHIAGFGPVLSVTLASGGTVVLMREFKAGKVLETIARERITYSVLVPAMIQLCVMEPSLPAYDLSSWRYCIYGGAIMPPAVIERFSTVSPQLRMINAYGATETCAVCTIMPPEMTSARPASVGLPLECDDIIVVDDAGRKLGPGQSGELLIRGPNVFKGYWNDDAATERAFQDGYWRSGDIGMRDADGLVYVQDRLKDMINRGGFKVFSAEVENALMNYPGVADCAVVGVPDPVLGEKTFAFVQRRELEVEGAALRDFLRQRIADYKVPDYWEVSENPVPRNQNGKLQKADMRALAMQMLGESRLRNS